MVGGVGRMAGRAETAGREKKQQEEMMGKPAQKYHCDEVQQKEA